MTLDVCGISEVGSLFIQVSELAIATSFGGDKFALMEKVGNSGGHLPSDDCSNTYGRTRFLREL
ncbi:hypothetical protein VN12_08440 [Pirellula sp. SH-Sr6A]|nr:hypothetical protein VN12_08440 [Pirellula sp. SH-Sr6A]